MFFCEASYIGLQLLSLLKNDDIVCEYKKTSCFPLICIFSMNLPRSRWPFAKEYERSSHIHHRWHYLDQSEFLPAKRPSQSCQKAHPSSRSGRHAKAKRHKARRWRRTSIPAYWRRISQNSFVWSWCRTEGTMCRGFISPSGKNTACLSILAAKNRGSDFQGGCIWFEQNAPP